MNTLVSIPVWCDLEVHTFLKSMTALFVSIPVWCDLELIAFALKWVFFEVSIPVWCDLELSDLIKSSGQERFQFQYGAIWSIRGKGRRHRQAQFQFQYGAIWR